MTTDNTHTEGVAAVAAMMRRSPSMSVDGMAEHLYAEGVRASIPALQRQVREVNELNGWFDVARPFAADIALLHSEVSEMYEGWRNDDIDNVHEEAADILIRLLDTAERHGIDLLTEVAKKLAKNRTRGYRHGGKAE